jgi:hypothetical protein
MIPDFLSLNCNANGLCQCILMRPDSLSVYFDDTWVLVIGLITDSLSVHVNDTWLFISAFWLFSLFISKFWWQWTISACWWYSNRWSVHVDDTWPSVHMTVTEFINKTLPRWSSWHFYLSLSLAVVTNAPLVVETCDREVSSTVLITAPRHCRFVDNCGCQASDKTALCMRRMATQCLGCVALISS